MNETLKRLLRSKFVPALMSVMLGIVLIIARRSALTLLVQIIAVMLFIGAAGCITLFFFGPVRDVTQIYLGAFLAIIGILVYSNAEGLTYVFPIIMGVMLMLNGLGNLGQAFAPPERDIIGAVLAGLVILFGILILFHPGTMADAIVMYIGIFYVLNGLFDLFMLHRIRDDLLE